MKKYVPFVHYLLYFAALAAFMPYIVLYYQELGLSGAQIGVLSSIGPLITLAAGPLWSGLADARRRHRLVLTLNGLATVGFILLFPTARGFAGLLLLGSLFAMTIAPLGSLADSAVMNMLHGDGGRYGRMRLGGTLGWGLAAPLVGLMIERGGQLWIFWCYAGLMLLAIACAQALEYPRLSAREEEVIPEAEKASADTQSASTGAGKGPTFWQGLGVLLADQRWLVLLATLFCGGVGLASVNTYLALHMQLLGASQSLIGIALTLGTISEIPALFFANRLTQRISARGLLLIALGAVSLRVLLTGASSYLPAERIFEGVGLAWNVALVFAAQLIHGLTFPLFWVAGVSFAYKNAPPGLAATAQGIMGTVFMGLGAAAGAFAGGLLIEAVGTRGMYLAYGYGLLAAMVIFAALAKKGLQVGKLES